MNTCKLRTCKTKQQYLTKGLCKKHYARLLRYGDVHKVHRVYHGLKHHPMYKLWVGMRQRCNDKNHDMYKYYGGRGVKVCKRWDDFSLFLKDVGERPSLNHSIDRINPNGNYSPKNVRWATALEQAHNKRDKI